MSKSLELSNNNLNIVGDLEGRLLTLQALLAKMPQDATLVSLGDICDRGPRTKETIEFLMKNGHTVQSNHTHMMLEACLQEIHGPGVLPLYYHRTVWPEFNGGMETMKSYDPDFKMGDKLMKSIPMGHVQFLKGLPMWIETDKYVFTHAPLHPKFSLADASDLGEGFMGSYDYNSENSLLWNRVVPEKPNMFLDGRVNVFGHNSNTDVMIYNALFPNGRKMSPENFETYKSMEQYEAYPIYAMCIDTSRAKKLTGLHLPTMTIYQQEFID